MKRRLATALALAALAAAGALAALSFAPTASAWSPSDLPPGWSITHAIDPNYPGPNSITPCPSWYVIHAPTESSPDLCENSPTFQADFDAWVNAHYTAPVTTTAPPPVTTTVVITTTTPAATTTAPIDTTAPPAPPPAPVTNTVTVTTTVSPVEQSLQDQINALTAQIAALTDRVTRLEKAGDAAWLAFQQAILGGSDPAAAADIARGTWLNVVNQLGAFAP